MNLSAAGPSSLLSAMAFEAALFKAVLLLMGFTNQIVAWNTGWWLSYVQNDFFCQKSMIVYIIKSYILQQ